MQNKSVIRERTLARFILRMESARAILGREKDGRKRTHATGLKGLLSRKD